MMRVQPSGWKNAARISLKNLSDASEETGSRACSDGGKKVLPQGFVRFGATLLNALAQAFRRPRFQEQGSNQAPIADFLQFHDAFDTQGRKTFCCGCRVELVEEAGLPASVGSLDDEDRGMGGNARR